MDCSMRTFADDTNPATPLVLEAALKIEPPSLGAYLRNVISTK